MDEHGAPEFYWAPKDNEAIVSLTQYRDMILVTTTAAVYVIREKGTAGLDGHNVELLRMQPVPSDGSLDGSPPSVSAHVEWVQHRDGVEITRADGVTIDGGSKS